MQESAAVSLKMPPSLVEVPVRFVVGDLIFNKLTRAVTCRGKHLKLMPMESKVLMYIGEHTWREVPVTLVMLRTLLYGSKTQDEKSILTRISKIRKTLAAVGSITKLPRIKDVGYLLVPAPIEYVPSSKVE